MSNLLKLTNLVINKNVIHHIDIGKDKIFINLMSNQTYGCLFGPLGWVEGVNNRITICKIKDEGNYIKVLDWINNEAK